MTSRANIAGHPVHAMLVPLPIGLFVFSLAADVAARLGWGAASPEVALYCMGGGIAGALLAAVFGFADFTALTDARVRKVAVVHMGINLGIVALYALNFTLRVQQGHPVGALPLALSVLAVGLLLVSGWLGGHMVYVLGAGVAQPVERRRSQVPVARERRRLDGGFPIGQH